MSTLIDMIQVMARLPHLQLPVVLRAPNVEKNNPSKAKARGICQNVAELLPKDKAPGRKAGDVKYVKVDDASF